MRTTSIKSIYLTKEEVDQLIYEYISARDYELAQHFMSNKFDMEFTADGELQIALDGEFEDKQ